MGEDTTTEEAQETVNALYFADQFGEALDILFTRSGLTLNRVEELDHTTEDGQVIKGFVAGIQIEPGNEAD